MNMLTKLWNLALCGYLWKFLHFWYFMKSNFTLVNWGSSLKIHNFFKSHSHFSQMVYSLVPWWKIQNFKSFSELKENRRFSGAIMNQTQVDQIAHNFWTVCPTDLYLTYLEMAAQFLRSRGDHVLPSLPYDGASGR